MLACPDRPRFLPAVERALGRTATVIQALAGGTHARTWLIQVASPELTLILREFPPGDDAAATETRILGVLDGLNGMAPQLVASDSSTASAAGSWTLISRLPGIADLRPAPPARLAEQLGHALARIHATTADGLAGFGSVFARQGSSPAASSGPAADVVTVNWERLASAPAVLTHYDFWSGNVLWQDGVLTGVVDWPGAATGPRGYDVGWCRLDLYLLYDEQIADRFLASYEAASGAALADPLLWDLWAAARSHENVQTWVPNYHDLGRADLTARELRRRHDAWTTYLLEHWLDH
jgi:aminoglycoside phosphotransferase (APT) family kinase protein